MEEQGLMLLSPVDCMEVRQTMAEVESIESEESLPSLVQ